MIIGRPLACEEKEPGMDLDFRQMVLSLCCQYSFPILFNVDLGHADKKLTIPIGAVAELELTATRITFALPDSGVV